MQILSESLIYKTIILPLDLCGCETCSVTLREEHRLRAFKIKVLRRMFGPKMKWREAGEDCTMRSFIT
jgi:hypothetical protein